MNDKHERSYERGLSVVLAHKDNSRLELCECNEQRAPQRGESGVHARR